MTINKQNIEELILLAIDNELNEQQLQALQTYLAQHTYAQEIWQQYAATKVEAEPINYPAKVNLYAIANKQKKNFTWVKYAAILLIGLAVSTYIIRNNNNKSQQALANQQAKASKSPTIDTYKAPSINTYEASTKIAGIQNNSTNISPNDNSKNNNLLLNNGKTPILKSINNNKSIVVNSNTYKKVNKKLINESTNNFEKQLAEQKLAVNIENNNQDQMTLIETTPINTAIENLKIKKTITYNNPVKAINAKVALVQSKALANIIETNSLRKRLAKSNNIAIQNLLSLSNNVAQAFNDFKSIKKDGVQIEIALPNL